MVRMGTLLNVIDNSGAGVVKCFGVLGVGQRFYGEPGDVVVCSVKKVNPDKPVKKGMKYKGVIVRVGKTFTRLGGESLRFDDNGVVLLKSDGTPLGTGVLGPVMLELRQKGYLKLISLAAVAI